jgi:hypothetical protein
MAAIGTVDLVDGHDGAQADLEGLGDHELGLGHWAFGGVHENDGAVHHAQDTLHLAAEIGVAWGVHDIDAGVLPDDRGRLGQDGNAALLFQVIGIHGALFDALVLAEGAGLLEQLVDEGGLAVVDVGDDGDIAKFHRGLSSQSSPARGGYPRAPGSYRAINLMRCNIMIKVRRQ